MTYPAVCVSLSAVAYSVMCVYLPQLRAALYDVHDVFFVLPLEERLGLLQQDRQLHAERKLREMVPYHIYPLPQGYGTFRCRVISTVNIHPLRETAPSTGSIGVSIRTECLFPSKTDLHRMGSSDTGLP